MTEAQKMQIANMRSNGLGYKSVANEMNLPYETVKSYCKRHQVSTTVLSNYTEVSQPVNVKGTTNCETCGKTIWQVRGRKKKRFCCDACRNKWWNSHLYLVNRKAVYEFVCPWCGKRFHVYGDKHRKYCSINCASSARRRHEHPNPTEGD